MLVNGLGELRVKVSEAEEAIPVEGAVVIIRAVDEGAKEILYSLLTDDDGLTEKIALPAPNKSHTLTPCKGVDAYARYLIEIHKNGLRPFSGTVNVFDTSTALINVNMLPLEV